MKHSTGKPTKDEQKRLERMLKLGCAACAMIGIPNGQCEVHHILDGNRRMGHWYTIPLCPGHHRGIWSDLRDIIDYVPPPPGKTLLVSIADGRKVFEAVYGTERMMWELVQKRLKLPVLWPISKIVPRAVV